jgi:hypothetical protein
MFPNADDKPVKRFIYELLLLEDVDDKRVQPTGGPTTFNASKKISQDIDNLLKVGFQKLQVSRQGSSKTDTQYMVISTFFNDKISICLPKALTTICL